MAPGGRDEGKAWNRSGNFLRGRGHRAGPCASLFCRGVRRQQDIRGERHAHQGGLDQSAHLDLPGREGEGRQGAGVLLLQWTARHAAPGRGQDDGLQDRRDGHHHRRAGQGPQPPPWVAEDDQVRGRPRVRLSGRLGMTAWLLARKDALAFVAATAVAALLVPACASGPTTAPAAGGTAAPRLADGHPDFNGYWNGNAPNPNGGRGRGGDGNAAAPANAPAAGNAAGGGNAGGGNAAGGGAAGANAAAAGRGARAGGGGRGQVMNRYADGSIIFDFSTEYNEENGAGRICQTDDCQAPNQPPYNDEWMVKVRAIAETQFGGTTPLDPAHSCRPQGVPRAGINGVQIVQTPQVVAILYEGAPYSTYRLIYTDGRQHPDDIEPSCWGHSIGHWDGDTLVVDTVGLTEESWVGGGGAVGRNRYTSIHSDKLHVTERFSREGDVLTNETTVEDPVAFTKPWVLAPRRVRLAAAGEEPFENICNQNKDHFVAPSAND